MYADIVDIDSLANMAANTTVSICGYVRKVFQYFYCLTGKISSKKHKSVNELHSYYYKYYNMNITDIQVYIQKRSNESHNRDWDKLQLICYTQYLA